MDKEQIERAREFLGVDKSMDWQPYHQDAGINVFTTMADFAAAEVARSRREIAAELREILENRASQIDRTVITKVREYIEKLEGEGQSHS